MRLQIALAVLVLVACGPAAPVVPTDPTSFAVDAKGATAVVDQSWTLTSNGQSIGIIMAAVRCGATLLLSDSQGLIRRLNLTSGRSEPSIGEGRENAAIAVDCGAGVVYSLGSTGFGKSQRGRRELTALDIQTGSERRAIPLDLMMMPAPEAAILNGEFILGGTWMPMPKGQYQHPPPATFFSDKKIGLRIDLADGKFEPTFDPYEMSCRGGGRCVGGSLSPAKGGRAVAWIATQPAAFEVGLYDKAATLIRRIDVRSPMFRSDGRTTPTADAESSVRWSTSNSLIQRADSFAADLVATTHQLTKLPAAWKFGEPVDFDWWLNVHSLDGKKLVSDIRLPGMPVGRDDTHIYLIDYGPGGRSGAPKSVKVLRISVKAGRGGFTP